MKDKELDELAEKLAKKQFFLKREWLKTCVEYLEHAVGQKAFTTPVTLENLIIHQFVNSEIAETYQPLLRIPKAAVKVVIVKPMIFQLLTHTNISIPLYEQLGEATRHTDDLAWFNGTTRVIDEEHKDENGEKERYTEPRPSTASDKNNNTSKILPWQPKKKRGMMKLELTDGQNSVKGIEMEEVFDEKELVPGVKLILTGKVKCRRGTLLLSKSNCLLLGGQVDSLKYDIVKKLSSALGIDLTDEKQRRENSLKNFKNLPFPLKYKAQNSSNPPKSSEKSEKSANSTKNSNKSLLNQSTISPFLVKTDRKTGEVKNPEKSTSKPGEAKRIGETREETTENWDFSIEELPPPQEPTPEPPQIQEQDTFDASFNFSPEKPQKPEETLEKPKSPPKTAPKTAPKPLKNSEKIGKIQEKLSNNWENRKEKSVEDWTFNSSSSSEHVHKTSELRKPSKPIVKKLPEQLLRDDEFDDITHQSTEESTRKYVPRLKKPFPPPTIEKQTSQKMQKLEISKKKKDVDYDRKGSEEEEIPSKRVKDDFYSMAVLPPCFGPGTKDRSDIQKPPLAPQNSFAKTIHGPRFDQNNPPRNPRNPSKISTHFPTVKSTPNGTRKPMPISIAEEMAARAPQHCAEIIGYGGGKKPEKKVPGTVKEAEKPPVVEEIEEIEEEKMEEELEENDEEMEDEAEQERRIIQTILANMNYQPPPLPPKQAAPAPIQAPEVFSKPTTVPATVPQAPPPTLPKLSTKTVPKTVEPIELVEEEEEEEMEELEEGMDDSILECTMDQEGRQELAKWGLIDERTLRKRDADTEEEEIQICGAQDYLSLAPDPSGYQSVMEVDRQVSERYPIPPQQASYHHQSYPPPQHNLPYPSAAPSQQWMMPRGSGGSGDFLAPSQRPVKSEQLEEERRMIRRRKITGRNTVEIEEEVKNKQSTNVQIYRTPFAKRIPSHDHSSPSVTDQLFQRIADLNIVPLGDALINRKFWMMSKIVVVMPTICHQVHELNSDGVDWQLQMRVSDTSASDVTCLVATSLLNRIFGFTVQQCKQLYHANQLEELRMKKAEAERKLIGFKRLDLLVWIEVSPEIDKLPMILDVKTMSDALNIL